MEAVEFIRIKIRREFPPADDVFDDRLETVRMTVGISSPWVEECYIIQFLLLTLVVLTVPRQLMSLIPLRTPFFRNRSYVTYFLFLTRSDVTWEVRILLESFNWITAEMRRIEEMNVTSVMVANSEMCREDIYRIDLIITFEKTKKWLWLCLCLFNRSVSYSS